MTRRELIAKCTTHLGAAHGCAETNQHEHYAQHMQQLLDLLIEELVGSPPGALVTVAQPFNPEQVLEEIAMAIKYRTISESQRWHIIYYHTRLTCVPVNLHVPEQIILNEFTERMVNSGFTKIYWHSLKQNIIKLYKELEP